MSIRASRRDVLRLRLARQGLAGESLGGPLAVAERLLAVQAQDYAASRWALGVRSPGTTETDVFAAINSGAIVRSWPMRGTLHFVPAVELEWMLRLTTPRLQAAARTRHAQLALDAPTFDKARAVALDALAGGGELTRAQFLVVLERNGIETTGQRGYHVLGHLAQTGALCWGRHVGKEQVLVRLDEWVPNPRRLDHDEALGEFVLRYFGGHGPATLKDFAWWSQLTVADSRIGHAVARDRLSELVVDGVSHYLPSSAESAELGRTPRQRSPLLALPAFDEYLLGYQDRSFTIGDGMLQRVVPGKNGIFQPIMVAAGRVIGTWRKHATSRGLTVEPEPFGELTDRQRGSLASAIRGYSRFLGVPATVLPDAGARLT